MIVAARETGDPSAGAAAAMANARSGRCDMGVALFDNPAELSSGWACRSGGRPFTFSAPSELATDVIWIASVHFGEYIQRAKKFVNLRRSDFLRSSLTTIASDLGRRISGVSASETVEILANVVQQAVDIATHAYGWQSPMTNLREDIFSDDLRRSLPPPEKAAQHFRPMLMSAYQSYSKPDRPPYYEPETVLVTLRMPRLEYAQSLLNSTYPEGTFVYMTGASVQGLPISELLNPEKPTLVEAAVELERIDPALASLVAFGSSGTRRNGAVRKWISQPELLWLSRLEGINIRVSSVLTSPSAKMIPDNLRLPAKLTADPLYGLSISAGLVAECHWHALSGAIRNPTTKTDEVTPLAVWLRALDRALCFKLAHKAHQQNFVVVGYGNGAVTIQAPRARLPELVEFAAASGVVHPSFHRLSEELGLDLAMQSNIFSGPAVDIELVRRAMLVHDLGVDFGAVAAAEPATRCMLVAKALVGTGDARLIEACRREGLMDMLRDEALRRRREDNVRQALTLLPATA